MTPPFSAKALPFFVSFLALAGGAPYVALTPAAAQGQITVSCPILEEQRREGSAMFEEAIGIEVLKVRQSTGKSYATIKAESSNPKDDVWWAWPGEAHLQAAEERLTEGYCGPG